MVPKLSKSFKKIVYGEGLISIRTEEKWFSRFKECKFDFKDSLLSGRLVLVHEDRFNEHNLDDLHPFIRDLVNECDDLMISSLDWQRQID